MKHFESGSSNTARHSEPFMGEESINWLFGTSSRRAQRAQSGRSLVEMLGTLVIMGLVSIGGFYGYSYAMKRYRANELLNEANKRAVMVATQLMAGKNPEDVGTGEFPPETPYGTFSDEIFPEGNDKFSMAIFDLEEGTCELMKSLSGGPIRRVDCFSEDNSFGAELFFNNDLSTGERASDFTYANCPNHFYKCETTKTCVTSAEECQPTSCEEVLECGDNGVWNEEKCKCDCNEGWYGGLCDSDCDGWKGTNGTCYACSSNLAIESTEEECNRCNETATPREIYVADKTIGEWLIKGKSYCRLITCPSTAPHRLFEGLCSGCNVSVEFSANDLSSAYHAFSKMCYKDCNKALRLLYYGSEKKTYYCYWGLQNCNSTEFINYNKEGRCVSCSNPDGILTYADQCSKCSNREMIYQSKSYNLSEEFNFGICALKECGHGNFKMYNGSCQSCSIQNDIYLTEGIDDCVRQCANTNFPRKNLANIYCSLVKEQVPACYGRGTQNADGTCTCAAGFSGTQCEIECNGNGIMIDGTCACKANRKGTYCDAT